MYNTLGQKMTRPETRHEPDLKKYELGSGFFYFGSVKFVPEISGHFREDSNYPNPASFIFIILYKYIIYMIYQI